MQSLLLGIIFFTPKKVSGSIHFSQSETPEKINKKVEIDLVCKIFNGICQDWAYVEDF